MTARKQRAGIASGAPGSVGVATLLTHEYPPYPTPVSVKKFLVFNELGQGYRSKFLIPQELFAESRH